MGPGVQELHNQNGISVEVIDRLRELHRRASDNRIDFARAGRNKDALSYEWFRDGLASIISMIEAEQHCGIHPPVKKQPAKKPVKTRKKELR